MEINDRNVSFDFVSVIPKHQGPCPAIISLNFQSGVPNKYLPAEEIVDRGYAIFALGIDNLAESDSNFKSGIFPKLIRSRKRRNAPGKIALWSYCAIVMADHISSLFEIDNSRIAISGHAECAKAALLAAGLDERIDFVIANDALSILSPIGTKSNLGNRLAYDFPYLFCPAFSDEPINDEHFMLISLCKGKNILVGCSRDDLKSNFDIEYEILMEALGENTPLPIQNENEIPTKVTLVEGDNFSYHLRGGTSYFSREDWNIYLNFIDKKLR